jgi:4-aminobutyrate aminotransferase-like enzyme
MKDKEDPVKSYAEYFEKIVDEETGAFICEYMQSCGGQVIPPKETFQAVYKILRDKGVVCIGDEVQTGFGRMGSNFWAF